VTATPAKGEVCLGVGDYLLSRLSGLRVEKVPLAAKYPA